MDNSNKWPAWFYGPNGVCAIFERAEDVVEGWVGHPSELDEKDQATEYTPIVVTPDPVPAPVTPDPVLAPVTPYLGLSPATPPAPPKIKEPVEETPTDTPPTFNL